MKIQAFFENARLLSDALDITPLLYGSLGLEYLPGRDQHADDIDILIPKVFIRDRWPEFKALLQNNGYLLIDEHEHEFEKDGVRYAYAPIEELESFAGIHVSEIATLDVDHVLFRLLSLPQYLQVYRASAKDGYRLHARNKKDTEKIAFIEQQLRRGVLESSPPKQVPDENAARITRI